MDTNRVNPLSRDIRVFLVLRRRRLNAFRRIQFAPRDEIFHPSRQHPIEDSRDLRDKGFLAEFWIGLCFRYRGRVWHILKPPPHSQTIIPHLWFVIFPEKYLVRGIE